MIPGTNSLAKKQCLYKYNINWKKKKTRNTANLVSKTSFNVAVTEIKIKIPNTTHFDF